MPGAHSIGTFLIGGVLFIVALAVVTALLFALGGATGYAVFGLYNAIFGASLNQMLGAAIGSTVIFVSGLSSSSSSPE